MAVWSEASPSVLRFAQNLIENFHPHLKAARIAFVFRDEAQKLNGRRIIGQASKVPAKMQPFLEYDFLIWLSEEDYTRMDDLAREALIDHELCHCSIGLGGWKMRPHDIQEFTDVIRRHGVWTNDVLRAKDALDQWQTQTLPGFLMASLEGNAPGKVFTISGDDLKRAAEVAES